MPRNKYPEVTEKAILDTAKRLFLEHGYEHVTLQDIAEACGLTRGAIYTTSTVRRRCWMPSPPICSTRRSPAVRSRRTPPGTGWRNYSGSSLPPSPTGSSSRCTACSPGPFTKAPKLVCAYLLSCRTSVVPMTRTFLEEGVSDGSITVDSPQIAAEVVAVFTNLLLSPLVFSSTGPDFQRKVACVSTMLESIGLPLINDQVSAAFSAMGAVLYGEERT